MSNQGANGTQWAGRSATVAGHRRREWRKIIWRLLRRARHVALSLLALALIAVPVMLAVALNAFGHNISGTAICETGGVVTNVQIVTNTHPLQRMTTWQADRANPQKATFAYWLPFGGRYQVAVSCGEFTDTSASSRETRVVVTCGRSKTLLARVCGIRPE